MRHWDGGFQRLLYLFCGGGGGGLGLMAPAGLGDTPSCAPATLPGFVGVVGLVVIIYSVLEATGRNSSTPTSDAGINICVVNSYS